MGIHVRKVDDSYGIWCGYNAKFLDPEWLTLDEKEKIQEYLRRNAFPKDEGYSEEDLMNDLLLSSGALIISCKHRGTAEFVAEMLSKLSWG